MIVDSQWTRRTSKGFLEQFDLRPLLTETVFIEGQRDRYAVFFQFHARAEIEYRKKFTQLFHWRGVREQIVALPCRSGCRSLKIFGRHRRQYTKQIARSLNYILNNPKCFDLTQLCVVKGHHCWLVHVDISVSLGSMLACGESERIDRFLAKHRFCATKEIFTMPVRSPWKRLSVKRSKHCCETNVYRNCVALLFRVPALKVTHDEEINEVSVDVCDDPFQHGVLDVSNLPLLITVGQVSHGRLKETSPHCNHDYFRSMVCIPSTPPSKKIPWL